MDAKGVHATLAFVWVACIGCDAVCGYVVFYGIYCCWWHISHVKWYFFLVKHA